ncbi:MAG: hypothetical protein ACOY16_13335 [Chloroflexota bacterium]
MKYPSLLFAGIYCGILFISIGIAFTGPAEKSLGVNVRVVYFHGAWVWTALAAILLAGGTGFLGLVLGNPTFHRWSKALGHTGLFYWISYLPLSMWAMKTNWNGLFLAEPRFRVGVIFAISGILLQAGISLLGASRGSSFANLIYSAALVITLLNTSNVMHPQSPIAESESGRIQGFYYGFVLLILISAGWMSLWWRKLDAWKDERRT